MKKALCLFLALCLIIPYTVLAENLPVSTGEYDMGMNRSDFFLQTVQDFAEYDYSDPNVISDENFFGVYSDEEWITAPLLNYDDYDGLSQVEEYAKHGEYQLCKDELLAYYQSAISEYKYSVADVNTTKMNLWAELVCQNYVLNSSAYTVLGKTLVNSEYSDCKVDVLSSIERIIDATDQSVSYAAITPRKDGYQIVINCDEDNKPYIEAVVNGGRRYYYPTEMTTVRAGDYWENPGETTNELIAEESFTSINNTDTADNYTRRSYLKFDFSDIESGDKISQAEIHYSAKMQESDNPTESLIEKNDKLLYIIDCMSAIPTSWTSDTLTWGTCFTMYNNYGEEGSHLEMPRYYTSIYPNNSEKRWRQTAVAVDPIAYLARLYYYTGEETYAYHALRYIMHNIKLIGTELTKDRFYQTALYSRGILTSLEMYLYCLIGSDTITGEHITAIMKQVYQMTEFLRTSWVTNDAESNVGSMCTSAMILMSMYFPEFKQSSEGITGILYEGQEGSYEGGWMAIGKERIKIMLKHTCFDDGGSTEVSMHYTITNLSPFTGLFSKCEALNVDNRTIFDDDIISAFLVPSKGMIDLLSPSFGTWQHGDESGYDSNDVVAFLTTLANKVGIEDNAVNYVISDREKGKAPEYTSTVIESTAKGVLRNSWNDDAVALYINADGGFASHGHRDDLAIGLYAYGKYLLSDSLRYTYSLNPISAWQASTRAHNTIEINNAVQSTYDNGSYYKNQIVHSFDEDYKWPTGVAAANKRIGDTHSENREFNDKYDFLRMESYGYTDNDAVNGDFKVQRDVLFVKPGYYIVSDYIKPENADENTYKQSWHYLPDADVSLNDETLSASTNFDGEANVIIAPVSDGLLNAEFKDGAYSYVNQTGTYESTDYLVYSKSNTGVTTFQTILYPEKPQEHNTITTNNIYMNCSDVNAFTASIKNDKTGENTDITYYTVLDDSKIESRDFAGYTTDCGQNLIEYDNGIISKVIIRNGTEFYDNDKFFVKSNSKISDLLIEHYNNNIYLTTSEDDFKLSDITVYNNKKSISKVYLNDNEVEFSSKGKYIYFGNEPIIDDNTVIDNPAKPEEDDNSPGHSIGGGGSGGGSGGSGGVTLPGNNAGTGDIKEHLSDKYMTELKDHWGKDEISAMIDSGYVKGNANGTLGLSDKVTRAEFVAMILRTLKIDCDETDNPFTDINKEDWFYDYMITAYNKKIINGYEGMSRPNDTLTRQEMAKILVTVYQQYNGDIDDYTHSSVYTDLEDADDWAKSYIEDAEHLKIMNGMSSTMFEPKSDVLREQAMVAIYRLYGRYF